MIKLLIISFIVCVIWFIKICLLWQLGNWWKLLHVNICSDWLNCAFFCFIVYYKSFKKEMVCYPFSWFALLYSVWSQWKSKFVVLICEYWKGWARPILLPVRSGWFQDSIVDVQSYICSSSNMNCYMNLFVTVAFWWVGGDFFYLFQWDAYFPRLSFSFAELSLHLLTSLLFFQLVTIVGLIFTCVMPPTISRS